MWRPPQAFLEIVLCGGTPLAGIFSVPVYSIIGNFIPVNRPKVVFLVVFLIFFFVQPKVCKQLRMRFIQLLQFVAGLSG